MKKIMKYSEEKPLLMWQLLRITVTFIFLLPPEVTIVAGRGNSCGMLVKGRKGPEKAELPFGSLMSCWKACQPYLHFNLHASLYNTLYLDSALKYLLQYNHNDLYMSSPITLWGCSPGWLSYPEDSQQEMSDWAWHLSKQLAACKVAFS